MEQKFEQIIPVCPACGTTMNLKTKGTDKFWGCPNWKTCGGKTLPYKGDYPKEKPQDVRPNTGNQIILDGLENIIKSQRDIWRLLDMINNKLNK